MEGGGAKAKRKAELNESGKGHFSRPVRRAARGKNIRISSSLAREAIDGSTGGAGRWGVRGRGVKE